MHQIASTWLDSSYLLRMWEQSQQKQHQQGSMPFRRNIVACYPAGGWTGASTYQLVTTIHPSIHPSTILNARESFGRWSLKACRVYLCLHSCRTVREYMSYVSVSVCVCASLSRFLLVGEPLFARIKSYGQSPPMAMIRFSKTPMDGCLALWHIAIVPCVCVCDGIEVAASRLDHQENFPWSFLCAFHHAWWAPLHLSLPACVLPALLQRSRLTPQAELLFKKNLFKSDEWLWQG